MSTSQAPISLVTGGSRGIGRAAALQLAARGHDVIVTYRSDAASAATTVADLEAHGHRAAALPLDVGSSSTFPAFVDAVRATLARWSRSKLTGLVNNAGDGGGAPFPEASEAQFQALFDVHLKGPYFLTQALLPLLADGASIVNVSSGLSRYTFPGQSGYGIMKGGVDVMTRYLARELGPRGITVNVVAPGGIATDFGGGIMRDATLQRMVSEQTALGRIGEPDDVGRAIAALLSPELRWATGQRIELTGGYQL